MAYTANAKFVDLYDLKEELGRYVWTLCLNLYTMNICLFQL